MNRIVRPLPWILLVAGLGTACSNPTVDPSSTFTVKGSALSASMTPLTGAQVRLMRFYDTLHLLEPSVNDYFRCTTGDCSFADLGLEFAVVKTTETGMDGSFTISVTGAEIAARGGHTDEQGKVEVSNLVVVIVDPADASKRAGVFTFSYLFQQNDKVWDNGAIPLWNADAKADATNAATSGLVTLSWNKLAHGAGSTVKNLYELDVGTANSRWIVHCREGAGSFVQGGCDEQNGKLVVGISAYSLYSYYSDSGVFTGYVAGQGVDFRYRTPMTIPFMLPDPRPRRESRGVAGIWAVSEMGQQDLLNTPAVDNNPSTRVTLNPSATAIYVKFAGAVTVTDAGLLNSLVKDASDACVSVEFTTVDAVDIGAAKQVDQWIKTGRFCGSTGAPNEMAAIMSFDTTASDGQTGAWMRFVVSDDANVTGTHSPVFQQIGEIAIYKKAGTM